MTQGMPEAVLSEYPLSISEVTLVSSKPTRSVWRVRAGEGQFALKAWSVPAPRARFLTEAHAHISAASDLVPRLLTTSDGRLFVSAGDVCFSVREWVEGRLVSLGVPDDLRMIAAALAEFHEVARGFAPSPASWPRNRLGIWAAARRRGMEALRGFRRLALQSKRGLSDQLFLEAYDQIWGQAEVSCRLLDAAPYAAWCESVHREGGFCHQDFARGNMVIGGNGLRVFDLDGIAIDLPATDLRKLLNRIARHAGGWRLPALRTVLESYGLRRPLSNDHLAVLMADLWFPHLALKLASKYFTLRTPERSGAPFAEKLAHTLRVEASKPGVLASVAARGDAE